MTAGIDAIGEVTIRLRYDDRLFSGHAANTDIIVASAQAYVNALNRLYAALQTKEAKIKAQGSEIELPLAQIPSTVQVEG